MTEDSQGDIPLDDLSQVELDQKPWKYIGYKEFARFVSSDDDFLAVRRFDRLHCRLLLRLQDQVALLEQKLDALDARHSNRQADDVDNGSVRNDVKERKELLDEATQKIQQYGELLCRFSEMKMRPGASRATVNNIKTWLANNNQPIHPKETKFIEARDLINISKSTKSTLRRTIEQNILVPTRGLFGLLSQSQAAELGPSNRQNIVQGTDEHVDTIAGVAVFLMAVTMLVLPMWVLAVVEDTFRKLAIITGFLIIFLVVLTAGTLARPFEILAATAGYSAVLVVFLQLGANYQANG